MTLVHIYPFCVEGIDYVNHTNLHFNIDRYFIRAESDSGKQNLLIGEGMAV